MEIIWKKVVGYEGFYEINNIGEIRSIAINNAKSGYTLRKEPRYLKKNFDKDGYNIVVLCLNGKMRTCKVHRLVAQAFIPNPLNLPQVNHKDENKANNLVSNLEWCNCRYNANYGTKRIRLSNSLRNNIKKSRAVVCLSSDNKYIMRFPSAKEAQRKTGIRNISSVCNKKVQIQNGWWI